MNKDYSNGYEDKAESFIATRPHSHIGSIEVQNWCKLFSSGSSILDVGCGCGIPISKILIENNFSVYGIDASAKMIDAYKENFPNIISACEPIEQSSFFNQTFDGIISWGVMFLLPVKSQYILIQKAASSLNANGRFLFTSPKQKCLWKDNLTELTSISLGIKTYQTILEDDGLMLIDTYCDEGENHYFDCVKQ